MREWFKRTPGRLRLDVRPLASHAVDPFAPGPARPQGRVVGYPVLADSHIYVCRTWDELAARLVWAREEGYETAKARRANGYVGRPLLPI